MKKIYTYTFLLLAFLVLAAVPQTSSAKSVQWNTAITREFYYCWSWGSGITSCGGANTGWFPGLRNPNVTVTYYAIMKNEDTGAVIADGAILSVGTRIRLVPTPHLREHISWFGTGYSLDSPYGHWNAGANPTPLSSRCDASNYVGGDNNIYSYWIYMPLVVAPPTISFIHTGTANLTCSESGALCTVNTPGTIQSKVNFAQTSGKFYYGYRIVGSGGCVANNVPLHIGTSFGYRNGYGILGGASVYILNVPTKDIIFNATAGSPGNPPNPPTITGPTSFMAGTVQTFGFTATDPDNDTIRYHIDWNNDGVVDVYAPAAGTYVTSGNTQTSDRQWLTAGAYTFQARTQDSNSLVSSWSSYTVTATNPPTLTLTVSPTSIASGNASTLSWVSTNTTSCTASNGWSGTKSISGSQSTGALTTSTTFTLTCSGPYGSVTQSVTVSVIVPTPTLTFTASPTVIASGNTSTLSWSSTNVTGCTASNGWSGSKATNGSESSGVLTTSTTFTLTCTGVYGSVTQSVTVTVTAPPAPTASIEVQVNSGAWTTANQTIDPTDTVNIRWSSTDATTCGGSGFSTGGTTSGTATGVAKPLAGTTKTYQVQCSGITSPVAIDSVNVTTRSRNPTLTPNDIIVASGASTMLVYDLNGNTSCTFSTSDSTLNNVTVTTNGARSTGAITQQTIYTLDCGGGNTTTVVINVEGNIQEQ